ncbi:MAG: GNAT family protein [Cyanobacteria bacterium P01_A01_bin.84]
MSSSQISLLPTLPENLEIILAMETDPENAPYIRHWERRKHLAALDNPDIAHLKIVSEDKILGYVILVGITNIDRSIEFKRIVIQQKGRGIGRQTIRLIQDLVFNRYQAHRLWLEVIINNIKACNLYLSEGFIEEGIHRESLKQENCFIDLKVMSILEREYRLNT